MDIFEKLKQYARMESEEDIRKFEVGVWGLAQSQDPEILKKLIDLFDDQCPYYEVMYSLVHAIEKYKKEIYVPIVVEEITSLITHATFWADCLCNRIFNDEKYLKIFRENMHLAPKESLIKLFDLMEIESPHHKDLIYLLRQELK